MSIRNGLFEVNDMEASRIAIECSQLGGTLFHLVETSWSKDKFFEAIRATLPLDPPLQSNRSWDALADSLWSGLDSILADPIVIIWENSRQMEMEEPEDFLIAFSILKDLTESLSDIKVTGENAKKLSVLRVI